nr:uncharacterized protein LOC109175403 [Ipomoea batatas]
MNWVCFFLSRGERRRKPSLAASSETTIDGSLHFSDSDSDQSWVSASGAPYHDSVGFLVPSSLLRYPPPFCGSQNHISYIDLPKLDLSPTVLTTVYSVLFRLAVCNWMPTLSTSVVSKKMALFLYRVRHMVPFDLGNVIFRHIMSFSKHKEPKVRLPFASLIFGLLSSQGFTPLTNEKLLDPPPKYTMDLRLTQLPHFDDRSSLAVVPVPVSSAQPASTPSGSSSVLVSLPTGDSALSVSSVIRGLRARVLDAQASLSRVKTSISTLQVAATSMEQTLVADMRELTRLELIRTSHLADHEEPVDASDGSGSPSIH